MNLTLKPGMYVLREKDLKKYKVISRYDKNRFLVENVNTEYTFDPFIYKGEGVKKITKKEALS